MLRRIASLMFLLWTVSTFAIAAEGVKTRATISEAREAHPAITTLDTLQIVGQFESTPNNTAIFGDTDHDGASEIILTTVLPPSFESRVRILEHVSQGQFIPVFAGPLAIALAAGDVDQDGRTDLTPMRQKFYAA